MPRVSIIMGVFNNANTLPEALDSISRQTFSNFELIVCDDGSSDCSLMVLYTYSARDDRLIILHNEVNKGLGYSLNRCIDIARGEFLVRMDADDISVSDRVKKLVDAMDEHPETSVIGSAMELFDENGFWGRTKPILQPTKMQIFTGPAVAHATTIMRKKIIQDVGAYHSACDRYRVEDYDLWCRLTERGHKILNISESLYHCRWEQKGYYHRRKLKHLLGFCTVKVYWCRQLNIGLKGWIHISGYYVKAFTPVQIKKWYHRNKLTISLLYVNQCRQLKKNE